MRPPLSVLFLSAALTCCAPPALQAESTGGFTATLSSEQQNTTGLAQLSAEQRRELNALVAREVSLARQGNVRGFAGTFTARRTVEERVAAGLDQLSVEQLSELDALVASALAAGPVQPSLAQQLRSKDVARADRLQVHGEVSLTYGWSRYGDFRAGSIYTTIHDPETGVSIGVGLSQSSGPGLWWDDCYEGARGWSGSPRRFRR